MNTKSNIYNWEETVQLRNSLCDYVRARVGNLCHINERTIPDDDGMDVFFMPLDNLCAPYWFDKVYCEQFKMISFRLYCYRSECDGDVYTDLLIDFAERYVNGIGWTTTESECMEDCNLAEQLLIAEMFEQMDDDEITKYVQ